jgi:hypothetical protein
MNISNNIKRIPANQIWDLKNSISEFILPRLELFIKNVENSEFLAIPTWVQDEANNEAMTDVETDLKIRLKEENK